MKQQLQKNKNFFAVVANRTHVGTDIQVIANYLDDSIRDIANAAALSSTLDEFSVCLKDAKRGAKLNSFSIYYPKGLFSAERKTGKAVPLHP